MQYIVLGRTLLRRRKEGAAQRFVRMYQTAAESCPQRKQSNTALK